MRLFLLVFSGLSLKSTFNQSHLLKLKLEVNIFILKAVAIYLALYGCFMASMDEIVLFKLNNR
jgi:hypothetical protein